MLVIYSKKASPQTSAYQEDGLDGNHSDSVVGMLSGSCD